MKKMILIISVLMLSILAEAQHLETTIKVVSGKVRIAVKAVGGDITGAPGNNFIFSVAIPKANQAIGMTDPTKLISPPTMVPVTLAAIADYVDPDGPGAMKYFNLFYSGPSAIVTYANGVEYELLELNFTGPNQSFPVSLICMTDGNPAAPVVPSQWFNYLEVDGAGVSPGDVLFYASSTSTVNSQMAADYSSGTALITTNTLITLPATLLNFSGYKNGGKNTLLWTTASESNNRGFEVLRSTDGTNYSSIGFVNSLAPDGTSTTNISYSFDDNNLAGKKQYYRLKQTDLDNRSKLSNIVLINGAKPLTLAIAGLFPNPASAEVNVIIDAPGRGNVTLVVSDIYGKTVKQKAANVETGSNTIAVDISALAKGSYLVKVLCKSSDCEAAVSKFVKQ